MWFFGFSTTRPANLWIFGAILLVILLLIVLKKMAVYLDPQASFPSEKDIETEPEKDHDMSTSQKTCTLCCNAGVIRTYALEELKMATNDFRIRIGVGATSFVYLAELGDGNFGAVKRVMKERGGCRKIFLDEVSVLLRISHPNLVGLLGFCLEKGMPNTIALFKILLTYRLLQENHFGLGLGLLSYLTSGPRSHVG